MQTIHDMPQLLALPIYPRFSVFPSPFLCVSVYLAHFSSLSRFCSALASPASVPSFSASSASCSDSVNWLSCCGLEIRGQ